MTETQSGPAMRFKRWVTDDSVSLSVHSSDACGIYVLEFADGEEYVGQTRHLLQRVSAHRRRWPGEIVAIQFCRTARKSLDQAERDVIQQRRQHGARLRNIDLVGLPLRSTVLDRYVDEVDIEDWLDFDMTDGEDILNDIGDRGVVALQKGQPRVSFRELAARPDYEVVRLGLASYLQQCVPFPHRTEQRIWVVTSMPATSRTKTARRLAAITINNVEALVLADEVSEGGERYTGGFLNVAPLGAAARELGDAYFVQEVAYGTTGAVTTIHFADVGGLLDLLFDPVVGHAAREFAVGLLRKGGSMMAKYHDYALADDVFATIEASYTAAEAN